MTAARRAWLGAAALAAAALGLPGVPARAGTPTPSQVAVVVDYDGAVSTSCTGAGQDGLTTLVDAGHRVGFGTGAYAGFVLTIDGHGQAHPDDTHYWSYWHDTGKGWTYASAGGGSYHPPAGSVDGWSYVDGSSQATPPPATSYAAICAGRDHASASPTRHAKSPAPPAKSAPISSKPARTSEPAAPARSSSAASRSHAAAATHTRPQSASGVPAAPSAVASSAPFTSPSQSPPGASSSPVALTHHADHGSSAAPAVGTALALVVVLGLGGAAFWRNRSGRGAP